MGRHSTIEKEYLREVIEGERRAERALRVISHQMQLIEKLSSEGLKGSKNEEQANPQVDLKSKVLREGEVSSDHETRKSTNGNVEESIMKHEILHKKLDSLHQKVEWLMAEQDSMGNFLGEVSQWKATMEGAILDINASVDDNIDIAKNHANKSAFPNESPNGPSSNETRKKVWRTARKYFTADQAHFLLS